MKGEQCLRKALILFKWQINWSFYFEARGVKQHSAFQFKLHFYFSLLFLKVTLGVHYILAWATGNNLIAFRNVEYHSLFKYYSGFKLVGMNVEVGILKEKINQIRVEPMFTAR